MRKAKLFFRINGRDMPHLLVASIILHQGEYLIGRATSKKTQHAIWKESSGQIKFDSRTSIFTPLKGADITEILNKINFVVLEKHALGDHKIGLPPLLSSIEDIIGVIKWNETNRTYFFTNKSRKTSVSVRHGVNKHIPLQRNQFVELKEELSIDIEHGLYEISIKY